MFGNSDLPDVGERRVSELIGALIVAIIAIDLLAVVGRWLLAPSLVMQDVPIAAAAVVNLALIFALNRTRHARLAAFLFCFTFVWLNIVEGLQRPEGPVWYALIPLAATLGAAVLRFRTALALAGLGMMGVLVVLGRVEVSTDRGTLIVMYVALASAAALGVAAFRGSIERERRVEFERLTQQLASTERLESIGRLAGGIAHDFNNLLAVILASADAVRAGDSEGLDDIVAAGDRATLLTKQLLAFSRQPGRRTVNVAIDEAIIAVRPLLRRLLPENIEFVFKLEARAHVRLEEQQLEQLLFNLAANARDAMPDGGRLTIESSLDVVPLAAAPGRVPGEYVVLRISDSGVGMDPKTQAHALEPFFTTKSPGKGTGLGLATVHGIVRQAGGFLELDSAAGRGTRFVVGLPRSSAAADAQLPPVAALGRVAGRVLLVEDEPLLMRATARLLSGLGLTVVTATRAEDVPRALAASPGRLALVVTDVVMPGQSGVELVQQLRASQPDLPVLLLSGYSPDSLGELLTTARTGFLAKPFATRALGEAVHELLAGSRPAVESPSRSRGDGAA